MRVIARGNQSHRAEIPVEPSFLSIVRSRCSWNIDGGIGLTKRFLIVREEGSFISYIGHPQNKVSPQLTLQRQVPASQKRNAKVFLEYPVECRGSVKGGFRSRDSGAVLFGKRIVHTSASKGIKNVNTIEEESWRERGGVYKEIKNTRLRRDVVIGESASQTGLAILR